MKFTLNRRDHLLNTIRKLLKSQGLSRELNQEEYTIFKTLGFFS